MSFSLVRQIILSSPKVCSRSFATAEAATITSFNTNTVLRTTENDPTHHTQDHIGLLYTLDSNVKKKLFPPSVLPKQFEDNCKTFAESSIVIRSPAVELISFLKRANYDHPVIRYVIYGRTGCGKSLTMAHALHYAHVNKFITLHVPNVWRWFCNTKEIVALNNESTVIDFPLEAASWLKNFSATNSDLITELNLRLSKDYVWNKRETTPANSPLNELVAHGIARVKYASAVIDGLIDELKLFSNKGSCKTMVAIDGFNGFFNFWTVLKTSEKVRVTPDKVTLTKSFLKAAENDWKNGAVILTVDKDATSLKYPNENHYPFHLLGKKGVEHIDPFIPIHVPEMNKGEFHNLLNYLEERKWLQNPQGRQELEFLSQRNPKELIKLCASL
uniref:Small ribosomal subunit protein mS29 n=2 Tax=Clastoptera arizonana TaxID=38151 RepID=A0A1B6C7Q1_9HEMI